MQLLMDKYIYKVCSEGGCKSLGSQYLLNSAQAMPKNPMSFFWLENPTGNFRLPEFEEQEQVSLLFFGGSRAVKE